MQSTLRSHLPPHSVSVGLPALAGRGKEQIPEGSMPDGSSIIHKLDEPSMGESGFSRRLPPLGGSGLHRYTWGFISSGHRQTENAIEVSNFNIHRFFSIFLM